MNLIQTMLRNYSIILTKIQEIKYKLKFEKKKQGQQFLSVTIFHWQYRLARKNMLL